MPTTRNKNKNKNKADPAERTDVAEVEPLLPRTSTDSASSTESAEFTVDTPATGHSHRRLKRYAIVAAALSLLFGTVFFVAVFLIVSVVQPGLPADPKDSWKMTTDPVVNLLGVSEEGVHVNVTFDGRIDIYAITGVGGNMGTGIWQALRTFTIDVGLWLLPIQALRVEMPYMTFVNNTGLPPSSDQPPQLPLLNVTFPRYFDVPVTSGEARPVAIEAVLKPIASADQVLNWGLRQWADGRVVVDTIAPEPRVSLPGAWWSRWAVLHQQGEVHKTDMSFAIPALPNLPPPGTPLNLSQLVRLRDYSISNHRADTVRIAATASIPNAVPPQYPLRGIPRFALPFGIDVDNHTVAEVVARVSGSNSKVVDIAVGGKLVDLEGGDHINGVLHRYLRGEPSPITVRGLGAMPDDYKHPDAPPPALLKALKSLSLDLEFPGPDPKPEVVKKVTIENMKIGEANGQMIASGEVVANVKLPHGFEQFKANITAIQPDVLVSDGIMEDDGSEYDPEHPPPNAFGRIKSAEYLNSTTAPDPNTPNGLVVRAAFKDLPLDVLPDRDSVLSSFVSRVIFKGSALAGIAGIANIAANVLANKHPLAIEDLPVHGEFLVKR